jgi:hypothetical protein
MTDTLTSKGLTLLDPLLNYDVNKFNLNTQKINDLLGTIICTSTTRPSTSLYDGMTLWETDTQRFVVRVAGAWVAVPSLIVVSSHTVRNAITTKYDGQAVYRQDRDWMEIWDGGAWRVVGVAHCASVTDRDSANGITGPYEGQLCVTIDTGTIWRRTAAATWVSSGNRLIAFGERSTSSSTASSSTAVGVLRLDNLAFRPGCSYYIYSGSLHVTSTVSSDNLRTEIRMNTAGTATTSSSVIPGALAFEAFGNTGKLETLYTPGASETASILLCIARDTGSGAASIFADATRKTQLFVVECPAVTNTGVSV